MNKKQADKIEAQARFDLARRNEARATIADFGKSDRADARGTLLQMQVIAGIRMHKNRPDRAVNKHRIADAAAEYGRASREFSALILALAAVELLP